MELIKLKFRIDIGWVDYLVVVMSRLENGKVFAIQIYISEAHVLWMFCLLLSNVALVMVFFFFYSQKSFIFF